MLDGLEWNEAQEGFEFLKSGLVSILAFSPDKEPQPLATAFLIAANDKNAVAISAAHIFLNGVDKVQQSRKQSHPTALKEFLPSGEEFSVDRSKLRAVHISGDKVEVLVVERVVLDEGTDLAVLYLTAQDEKTPPIAFSTFLLNSIVLKVGDIVGVAGFAEMATLHNEVSGSIQKFSMTQRLVVRTGRIKAIHLEGHTLCKGPCLETTIPVFGGMSGGPVFLIGNDGEKINPCAFVSSDPDYQDESKNDRSKAGSCIAALLPIAVINPSIQPREVLLHLNEIKEVGASDSSLARLEKI